MKRYKKSLSLFLILPFIHGSIAFAGDESWHKPYRSNFKSPENYTSLKRFQQLEAEERHKIQQRNNVAEILKMQQQENARLIEEHAQKMRAANLPKSIPPSAIKEFAPKIKPPEKMRINSDAHKVKAVRWENPKPVTPQRNVTVEKKFIDGRQHTIKTVERFDKQGNLTRRDVVDRVRLDKRTTLTLIKTYSPSGDLIRQVEKFKIKGKGGYQVQKFVSTQFDNSENSLNRMLVKNEFKRTGFFNSTFGKILGIGLVVGAAILAPAMLGIAAATKAGIIASAVSSGLAQFGLSLAQGMKFKEALKAAGISMAATIGGMVLGPQITAMLGKIPGVGAVLSSAKNVLTTLGDKISGAFGSALAETASEKLTTGTFLQKFTPQFSLRLGSEVFADKLGKKLGVFATVATLSVAGTLANSVVSAAVGAPVSQFRFSQQFANNVFSGLLQGAVAESLKNHHGPAAQFLNQLGSSTASNISLTDIAESFNKSWAMRVANDLFKNEGITISDIQDAVVLPNKDLLVLFKKNQTLQYALVPSKQYSQKNIQNSSQTVTDNIIEFGDDVFKQYQRYQAQTRSNFIGVGGADAKQVPAAGFGYWKDRSPDGIHTGNVTYGDTAHYHDESGVGYILEGLQRTGFDLRNQFYQKERAQGIDLGPDFLMGFPHVLSTVKRDARVFTGQFNEQKLPVLKDINPRVGIKVYNVQSPAYFFSPGNPEQLAKAMEASFRNQDVNVVIAHSYGGPTAVAAAKILESRGVKIDYLALIDPSGRSDLVIPGNVKNARVFYQTQKLTAFLTPPSKIKTQTGFTNMLSPIEISKSHIDIDNDYSVRRTIENDFREIQEEYYNQLLFLHKYGDYIRKLFDSRENKK